MKKPGTKSPASESSAINTPGRRVRGRTRGDASFPVAPASSGLPDGYPDVLGEIKRRIQTARLRTVLAANAGMITLYWEVGGLILERQEREGWGARVIDRLAADLSAAYPDMAGLSPRNLHFMRSFAAAYPDGQIVKQLVSQLPWGHVIRLLQRIKDPDVRHWYAKACIDHGWSRNILRIQQNFEGLGV